jgi:hypothetical protein
LESIKLKLLCVQHAIYNNFHIYRMQHSQIWHIIFLVHHHSTLVHSSCYDWGEFHCSQIAHPKCLVLNLSWTKIL